MSIREDSVVFLLGAGASVDAGIIHAKEMTDDIENKVKNHQDFIIFNDLYNYLKSSIVYQRGLEGNFSDHNATIEDLLNALSELNQKHKNKLYPFIGSWNVHLLNVAGKNFENVASLDRRIREQLFSWVNITRYDASHYFKSFGQFSKEIGSPIRVFTLNYDLCVEKALEKNESFDNIFNAFMEVDGMASSPLYRYGIGLTIALVFAWFLGFGSTIAEPALSALGITAEELTNGVFKKKTLIIAVSFGVACGIALGIAKLIFDLPLIWLLVGSYSVAAVLTLLSSEVFVNVAWDSAGVTTGPVTVPLVLALGLGFGNATQAVEGFGILCLASAGPIITVLITGLWSRYKEKFQINETAQTQNLSTLEVAQDML